MKKTILWSLFCVLGASVGAWAQGTGDSPCRVRMAPSRSSTVLSIDSYGKITHSGEGEGREIDVAEMPNAVPAGDNGWVDFEIKAFGTPIGEPEPQIGAIELGIEDAEGQLSYFTISAGEAAMHYKYKEYKLVDSFEATFVVDKVYRVERNSDELHLYRMAGSNPQLLSTITGLPNSTARFRVRLANRNSSVFPRQASYSTGSCPPYVLLKHRLDGSFLQQTDDVLRFKFEQQYATLYNNADSIGYTIYDWERNVAQQGILLVYRGTSWRNILLSGLTDDTYYTLEIVANKGEHYYLRFKTKQP